MSGIADLKIFGFKITYSDELDLMRKVLNLYAKVINIDKNENFLSPRLINVLSFYVLKGYSSETKTLILDSLGINTTNLNQINAELTRKLFLKMDAYNFRKKHLSDSLIKLREYFLEGEYDKLFMINFNREE